MTLTETPMADIDLANTELLFKARAADDLPSFDALLPLVYGELTTIARALLRGEAPGCSLGATDLAHEAFLRLAQSATPPTVESPRHVCNLMALTMRRILVDRANRYAAERHGGGVRPVPLNDGVPLFTDYRLDEVIPLDEAMERVRRTDPLGVEIANLRFFCGLKVAEVADLLGMSVDQVKPRWIAVRVQLRREVSRLMGRGEGGG